VKEFEAINVPKTFNTQKKQLIKYYSDRTIMNKKSVSNILELLGSTKKVQVEKGKRLFESINTKTTEKIEKEKVKKDIELKRQRSASRIQKAFDNRIILGNVIGGSALKNAAMRFKIHVKSIGYIRETDYDGIVYKAFNAVLDKSGLKNKIYKVFGSASFSTNGLPNYAIPTGTFDKKDKFKMLKQLVKNMEGIYDRKAIKNLVIEFGFVDIPSGGAWKSDKKKDDIYDGKSVIQVKNDDNNCFWYALTNLIYSKHKQEKQIKMGRKIRTTLAKELCETCEMTWDEKINIGQIGYIEEKLKININIVDIDEMPASRCCSSIMESLKYYNHENMYKEKYWLLFDTEHYHSITSIKGLLNIDYFCDKCMKGFKALSTKNNHICIDNVEAKVKEIHIFSKDNSHYLKKIVGKGGAEEIKQFEKCKLKK
jgi:hypothetical protein